MRYPRLLTKSTIIRSGSLLAAGLVAGWAIARTAPEEHSMQVDSGALGALVWETVSPSPSAPPQCTSTGPTGIGKWRCVIRYAQSDTPSWAPVPKGNGPAPTVGTPPAPIVTVTLTVDADGSVLGRTDAGGRVQGCCVLIG